MSVSRQWRYKIFLGLMILYMATACIVACAFLWNMTVTHYSLEENTADNSENPSLVPICAVKKDIESDPYLNCSLLDTLSYEKFVANGWTKIVYRAKLDNSPQHIAIKVVNLKGKDVTDCAKSEPLLMCHNKAVDKLVREINFLKALNHDTIIKLKYYCSKTLENNSCMKYAVIATEIGEPITNLKLLQMTWKERKKIIIDLVELLDYAHKSPLGVLGLLDLRRQQFVLANGHMKLADLDDVVIDDPPCITDTDCLSIVFFLFLEPSMLEKN